MSRKRSKPDNFPRQTTSSPVYTKVTAAKKETKMPLKVSGSIVIFKHVIQ